MTTVVTLSAKNQIVIPRAAREALQLKPGQQLLVMVRDDHIVMVPQPDDFVSRLRGLHKDVWQGKDTNEYLKNERDGWDD